MKNSLPDSNGYFGKFGGRYVIETLMPVITELERVYNEIKDDPAFREELENLLSEYAGRPTPLYYAERLSEYLGKGKVYLKREDLLHTGAHKINNTLGQGLMARHIGKTRLIAETGAGQHGVATATVAALFGMRCDVYMGTRDMERQKINVFRMKLLGANVIPVDYGARTLKDAINEALRDWLASSDTTHYVLGSVLGPHPFPMMVRDFQSVIGRETREQILEKENRLPTLMVACVGGGSNSLGLFYEFLDDKDIKMVGVEAGGLGIKRKKHAARFQEQKIGILHGTRSFCLQDPFGQIRETHSISAGLDYPSVGPEHAYYFKQKRINFSYVLDDDALKAFSLMSHLEGIIPALESAHAIAWLINNKESIKADELIVANLSGRGDKDVHTAMENLNL